MKKSGKRLTTLLLAAVLCLGCLTPALAASPSMSNYVLGNRYSRSMFSDVNEYAWYGDSGEQVIRNSYNLGFMDGLGGGKFGPEENLTIAQAVTIAARVRDIYEGGTGVFSQSDPWYKVYFDYAKSKGIIPQSFFTGEENVPAHRCEMAYIFANTLPEKELAAVKTVASIPDVTWRTSFAQEIFTLYGAGILVGNDKYGTFAPDTTITRSAAAAIVTRLVLPAKRQTAALTPEPPAWLKDYTNGQVLEYFLKLAYSGQTSNARKYLVRFTEPICYYVGGTPNYLDMNKLNSLIEKLNAIEGFPGMQPVGSAQWANVQIYFVSKDKFKSYTGAPAGSLGYTEITANAETGGIKKSVICIANEIGARATKDSIISEELLQAMGLNYCAGDYPESVFYLGRDDQVSPVSIDWAVLELLYSGALPAGGPEDIRTAVWNVIEQKANNRIEAEKKAALEAVKPSNTSET